uniref:Importin subunit alpha n=1 Tax=Phaeomonas parva TaxID=124430 RepID=A0A7S1XWA2_9STRA|mmetsp:Transcript_45623/g.142818  ORF Transcript_45623/g.142818 Transcript_45623/m.142818 type:complete len:549 (+) Transcript_45623:76-1722(+)|eukprot:CAMPEP_0118865620 /NCGR_PEP_ID=MMETSP1163-20130328/9813_1 /TAXON_ID=124430 /ORGANISM="Phaeomonas parva, Strain CCMP2877" /LENGTH=548 /DNA_ID=CAMNT_0006799861 /DNA_START=42 /DNA_END=1688 /DNA_ORIENTATION=+
MERRKADFKKGVSQTDARRRRGETSVRIRKNKREEGLQKRRAMMTDVAPPPAADGVTPPPVPTTSTELRPVSSDIPRYAAELDSSDPVVVRAAVRAFRRLLSAESKPPVLEVMEAGVLPKLCAFLGVIDDPELLFEAAWALTNIASTDYTNVVVDGGAVEPLVELLMHYAPNVREQAAWCLGNVAGDSTRFRDFVLKHNALQPLLVNIMNPASPSLLRNTTWALSNCCRGKPTPDLDAVSPAVAVLKGLLETCQDPDVLMDACWALSYVSDGNDARIEAVVSSGVVPFLVRAVAMDNTKVVVPALRTLGNIVSGSDTQTQAAIDSGVLQVAPKLLTVWSQKNILKETCWMLSNIAAGNKAQVAELCAVDGLAKIVIAHMDAAHVWDVRKEACWVVANVGSSGSPKDVQLMVEEGAIYQLCQFLDFQDARLTQVVLDGLESMLRVGREVGEEEKFATLVDEAGGLDKLEGLQEHQDETIYNKAVNIIETYFNDADEVEDENLAPAVQGNSFAFGLNQVPDAAAAPQGGKGLTFDFGVPSEVPAAPLFQF